MQFNSGDRWRKRKQRPTPLFDSPRPSPADTSLAAAKSVAHARKFIEERVLAYVAGRGSHGATAEEVATALELRTQTCSARCSELRDAGRLHDSGRTRPTSSGRMAAVLICPMHGGDGCSPSAA